MVAVIGWLHRSDEGLHHSDWVAASQQLGGCIAVMDGWLLRSDGWLHRSDGWLHRSSWRCGQ